MWNTIKIVPDNCKDCILGFRHNVDHIISDRSDLGVCLGFLFRGNYGSYFQQGLAPAIDSTYRDYS